MITSIVKKVNKTTLLLKNIQIYAILNENNKNLPLIITSLYIASSAKKFYNQN